MNRVSLRLDPCEDLLLPNGLLAAAPWLAEAEAAAAAVEAPVAIVNTSSPDGPGAAGTSKAAWPTVCEMDGDNAETLGYNAVVADLAARQVTAEEARPAMMQFSFENPDQRDEPATPEAEPPFANPFQPVEFANELTTNPLSAGEFLLADASGDSSADSSSSSTDSSLVGDAPSAAADPSAAPADSSGSVALGGQGTASADPSLDPQSDPAPPADPGSASFDPSLGGGFGPLGPNGPYTLSWVGGTAHYTWSMPDPITSTTVPTSRVPAPAPTRKELRSRWDSRPAIPTATRFIMMPSACRAASASTPAPA